MFDYLQKFNQLPEDLRRQVSSPAVLAAISQLEKKYQVDLAIVVMKALVKEIKPDDLVKFFIFEYNLNDLRAQLLVDELKEKVLAGAAAYLGLDQPAKTADQSAWRPPDNGLRDDNGQPARSRGVRSAQSWLEKPAVKGSDFFFSPEDEEEIRKLAQKVNGFASAGFNDDQADDLINKINQQARIQFSSHQLADRFKQIIKSYLKGIRDRVEAKQAILKSVEAGGLGLEPAQAEKILSIIDGHQADFRGAKFFSSPPASRGPVRQAGQEKLDRLITGGGRDIDYNFNQELKNQPPGPKPAARLDPEDELAPPPPSILTRRDRGANNSHAGGLTASREYSAQKTAATVMTPAPAKTKIPTVSGLPTDAKAQGQSIRQIKSNQHNLSEQNQIRRPSNLVGKVKMEDVKFIPKVKILGPIDELRYLNLVNFRRLSKDVTKTIAKIKEKITLLEDDGYDKRLAGIKAWRSSPVNKLYLAMGQSSISEKKPIGVIIEERKNQQQDYLTAAEFEAVMDLNKELRF